MHALKSVADWLVDCYTGWLEPVLFRFQRQRLGLAAGQSVASLPVATLDFQSGTATCGPDCEALVGRYQRYYQRFLCLDASGIRPVSGFATLAAIDLGPAQEDTGFAGRLRQTSDLWRGYKKARKLCYEAHAYQHSNHIPDVVAIRKSLKWRAVGPVFDAFVLTVDSLGGIPGAVAPLHTPRCGAHWEMFLGVFLKQPGYRQGQAEVGERLVAYTRLYRIGNSVNYAEFMGHGEHLGHGVMKMLHLHVIQWIQDPDNPLGAGVRFLTYGAVEQGRRGLWNWKHNAMFRPHVLRAGRSPVHINEISPT